MNDAEILDADVVEVPNQNNDFNANKTEQVINMVQINPTVQLGPSTPVPKNTKLQKETIESILKLYKETCNENGFDVQFDIENIQKNFEEIISDDKEKLFRILISKAFGKFQVVFYQRAMNSVMALMDQISSPEVINDKSVSIEWKTGMIQQLLSLMDTVSNLYEKVKVDHPELILKNLKNAQNGTENDLRDIQMNKNTINVMKQLKNISLKYKEK